MANYKTPNARERRLSVSAIFTMQTLYDEKALTLDELIQLRATRPTRNGLYHLVERLEDMDLVKFVWKDVDGRRRRAFALTKRGIWLTNYVRF